MSLEMEVGSEGTDFTCRAAGRGIYPACGEEGRTIAYF